MHLNAKPFDFLSKPFCKVLRVHFNRVFHDSAKYDIERFFPNIRYIRIYREDLFRQAVSLYFSRKTQHWSLSTEEQLGWFLSTSVDFVDDELLECYDFAKAARYAWDAYLQDTPHYLVEYESLKNEPERIYYEILDYLGLEKKPFCGSKLIAMTRPEIEEFVARLKSLVEK
jgi:LPS sulfotransferase NodH